MEVEYNEVLHWEAPGPAVPGESSTVPDTPWCQECNRGYSTKQALVAHLKAKHGSPPTVEQLTCPTCSKVFKLIKTMRKHMASHKDPFYCRVKGCSAGPFLLPKHLNRHVEEKHSFSARKE